MKKKHSKVECCTYLTVLVMIFWTGFTVTLPLRFLRWLWDNTKPNNGENCGTNNGENNRANNGEKIDKRCPAAKTRDFIIDTFENNEYYEDGGTPFRIAEGIFLALFAW